MSLDLGRASEPAPSAATRDAAAPAPASDRTARERQREQLTRIAQEFESMLLVQVLRDMRRAGSWEDGEHEVKGFGAQTMSDTIDVELAGHLSRVKGLGLASQLLESMGRMDGVIPGAVGPAPGGASGAAGAAHAAIEALRRMQPEGLDNVQPGALLDVRPETLHDVHEESPRNGVQSGGSDNGIRSDVPIKLTSAFGWRRDPFTGQAKFHRGVDLAAAYGQDVQAARAGKVAFSGTQGGYGTTVVVEHADGSRSRYAHLSATLVEPGTMVAAGQLVGRAGSSGRATGTHLHFEVTGADGKPLSPSAWSNGVIG